MIRILALLISFLSAGTAYACEELLQSPYPQLQKDNFVLSSTAKYNLSHIQVRPSRVRELVDEGKAFVVEKRNGDLMTILFDSYADKDRGIMLTIVSRNGTYFVEAARWSHREDEMYYFRAVAEDHWLRTERVPLQRRVLHCAELTVAAWVKTKLWLKHDLTLDEVARFIGNAKEEPHLDVNSREHSDKPRWLVPGLDDFGRRFVAVVADEGQCNNFLVTAFALHH